LPILLDGKSEVLLDVKIYEVENTRTRLVGVQLPQTTTLFNVPSELNSVISGNSSLVQQIIPVAWPAPETTPPSPPF
jgi:general secretion pathway protein D